VIAAFALDEAVRRAVLALKYRNRRRLATWFAARMAATVESAHGRAAGGCEVVTWAPTGARRRRRRGYDQAELLARALARELGVPCRGLLRRRAGGAQTGRSRTERLDGPTFAAFVPRPGIRVLLVDDVVTTGATLAAARAALVDAGAAGVVMAAVAATPRRATTARARTRAEGTARSAPVGS
jgi:predicted amidophosphoribosyltransferase